MPISVKAEIFPLLVPWHTLPSKTGWYVAILDPDICVSGCWLWSSKQGSMYLTILLWMLITAQRHYWGGCWPCHRLFHTIHVLWWFRDAPCYLCTHISSLLGAILIGTLCFNSTRFVNWSHAYASRNIKNLRFLHKLRKFGLWISFLPMQYSIVKQYFKGMFICFVYIVLFFRCSDWL